MFLFLALFKRWEVSAAAAAAAAADFIIAVSRIFFKQETYLCSTHLALLFAFTLGSMPQQLLTAGYAVGIRLGRCIREKP